MTDFLVLTEYPSCYLDETEVKTLKRASLSISNFDVEHGKFMSLLR
jgi:hypothetical protein